MPTHLPPDIQNTLAGLWCYGQEGKNPEILAHLMDDKLAPETVRDWTELVRYIPAEMLRPTDPPASHWHQQLAGYCQKNQTHCRYSLQWMVHHLLAAGLEKEAAGWLDDFDYLYRRLQLGSRQARVLWQELLQLPAALRPAHWMDFWWGRQFRIDPTYPGPNPEPHLTFLALADGYAENSRISQQAAEWLSRQGPEKHWLRLRFRPDQAYAEPLILELPEEDIPAKEFNHNGVAQILVREERAFTVTAGGVSRAWDLESGLSLGRLPLPPCGLQLAGEHLLALSGNDLFVLNPATLEVLETQTLPGEKGWRQYFSAAAERLVAINSSRQLLVWDWRKGKQVSLLPPLTHRSTQELQLSRDGRRVLTLGEGEAQGWQVDTGRYHRHTLRPWAEQWADGRVRLEGEKVVTGDGRAELSSQLDDVWEWSHQGDWAILWVQGSWACWNLAEGQSVARWGWPLSDARVGRDGRERYTVKRTGTLLGRAECVQLDGGRRRALCWKHGESSAQILDLEDGHEVVCFQGQGDALLDGCLSGDGRRAATVSKAGNLRIWDSRNGKCLRLLKGRSRRVALNEDGSRALSGDEGGQVRLWDARQGNCLAILEGHNQAIEWLAFTQDGGFVSGDASSFQIWGPDRARRARLQRPPRLYAREVSPCGRYLYAEQIGPDRWGQALVYDLDQGSVASLLPCPTAKPSASVFSADSQQLAVANQEGEFFQSVSLRLWQLGAQPQVLASYRLPLCYNCLALGPRHVLASSKGNQIQVWRRGAETTPGHEANILCLARDGSRLITGSIDKTARIWNLETGACEQILAGGERWVQKAGLKGCFAFTRDDLQSTLWDLDRSEQRPENLFPDVLNSHGEALTILQGGKLLSWNPRRPGAVQLGPHPPAIACCAFSPDGTQVMTASPQGSLKLWELSSQRCLQSWETPLPQITSLQWNEPEQLILESGQGQDWSWDIQYGRGTRLATPTGQGLRLEFGTSWHGKPLEVRGRHDLLAGWWGQTQLAEAGPHGHIVAAQTGGELAFLELMPPGPVGERPRPKTRKPAARAGRARVSGLQRTPLDRLKPCQRILLVASGGRSDLLAAVPWVQTLRGQGKEVFVAAPLSGRKQAKSQRFREIPAQGKNFENRLTALLQVPLYGFAPEGTLPRLEAYRELMGLLAVDALVLVEAGVETLLRGDEPSLGTAADDLVSLAAARQLELPCKMLVNFGLGYDLPKGVCHAYTLEAMAELTQTGGFWGSFSLLPSMPEFATLQQAAALLAPSHPVHPLLLALGGEFGGEAFLNPLMNQYWCFDLDQVAARCRLLEWLQDKITAMDVHRALTNYLTVTPLRAWTEIPC